MDLEEEYFRSKVSFMASYEGIYNSIGLIIDDADPDHLGKVVFARFLHWKVFFLYSLLKMSARYSPCSK